jgi:hypothetical protein
LKKKNWGRIRICVPVGWQIYARHGKASGRTFFPTNQQLVLGKKQDRRYSDPKARNGRKKRRKITSKNNFKKQRQKNNFKKQRQKNNVKKN